MLLIDDVLILPVKGLMGIVKKIHEMVERELYDETRIREKLMSLQLRFELEEISEEEYHRHEKELLNRLDAARRMKEGGNEDG